MKSNNQAIGSGLVLTFFIKFQIFIVLYLLCNVLLVKSFAGQKLRPVFVPRHVTCGQSQPSVPHRPVTLPTFHPLTVAVGVNGVEAVLVFLCGLLEMLLRLLHDPPLHLLGADAAVLVEVHSEGSAQTS